MNKVFKVIWNAATQSWVAVSELQKAKGKGTTKSVTLPKLVAVSVGGVALLGSASVMAATATTSALGSSFAITVDSDDVNYIIASDQAKSSIVMGVDITNAAETSNLDADTKNLVVYGSGIDLGDNFQGRAQVTAINSTVVGSNISLAAHNNYTANPKNVAVADAVVVGNNIVASTGADGNAENAISPRSVTAIQNSLVAGNNITASNSSTTYSGSLMNGVALGNDLTTAIPAANTLNSITVGTNITNFMDKSVAIGNDILLNRTASGQDVVAIGNNLTGATNNKLMVGKDITTNGFNMPAIGVGENISFSTPVVLTDKANNYSNRGESIAMGYNLEGRSNTVIVGTDAQATATQSIVYGINSIASGQRSIAMGYATNATHMEDIAIGYRAKTTEATNGNRAIAIGSEAKANSTQSIALGYNAKTFQAKDADGNLTHSGAGNNAVAIGSLSSASGRTSLTVGQWANSTGSFSTALAPQSNADGEQSISVGRFSHTTNNAINGIAIGTSSNVDANQSIAVGYSSKVNGDFSGAVGDSSTVNGTYAYAIGNNNTVGTNSTYALGSNITTTLDNSVFLGDGAATFEQDKTTNGIHQAEGTAASAYSFGTLQDEANAATYENLVKGVGDDVVGVVSIGNATATRQLQGVAAGVISANSTDAINGSQLYWVAKAVESSAWTIQGNGEDKGSIGSGDVVNFIDGNGTTVVVNEGKVEREAYTGEGQAYDADGKAVVAETVDGTTTYKYEDGTVYDGDLYSCVTKTAPSVQYDVNLGNGTNTNVTYNETTNSYEVNVQNGTTTVGNDGKAVTTDGDKVATVTDIVNTINNVGWFTNTSTGTGNTADQLITAGHRVDFEVGNGLTLSRVVKDGNVTYTYAAKSSPIQVNAGDTYITNEGETVLKQGDTYVYPNGTTYEGDVTNLTEYTFTNGDTVNYVDGKGTEANLTVATDENGNAVGYNVTFDVKNSPIQVNSGDTYITNEGETVLKQGDTYVYPNGTTYEGDVNNLTEYTFTNGDTINYVDGKGTKANMTVATDENGNPVGYDVTFDVDTGSSSVNPDGSAKANDGDEDKVATVGDIVNTINNAGWNIQQDGEQKDLVTPSNNVSFNNGTATLVNVTSDGTVTNVNYSVKFDGKTITTNENGELTAVAGESPIQVNAGDTYITNEGDTVLKQGDTYVYPNGTTYEGDVTNLTEYTFTNGDTVNYVDGKGTEANLTVATDKDGNAVGYNVTFDVKDSPIQVNGGDTYITNEGETVLKQGDTYVYPNGTTYEGDVNNLTEYTFTNGDTINYVDGKGTEANVTVATDENGNAVGYNVTFDVKNSPIQVNSGDTYITKEGETVLKQGDTYVYPNGTTYEGDVTNLTEYTFTNGDTINYVDGKGTKANVTVATDENGNPAGYNVAYDVNFGDGSHTNVHYNPETDSYEVNVETGTSTVNPDGTAQVSPADANKVATVGDIVNTINNVSWNVESGKVAGSTGESVNASTEKVKAGETVTLNAGNNIRIEQEGQTFNISTTENVSFTNLNVSGNTSIANLTVAPNSNIDMGDNQITNVSAGAKTQEIPTTNEGDSNTFLDLANSDPNNAVTVEDLSKYGWIVKTENDGNSSAVRNADVVNMVGGDSVTVTSAANTTSGEYEVAIDVNKGNLSNTENGKVDYADLTQAMQDLATAIQSGDNDAIAAASANLSKAGNAVATAANVQQAINNSGWTTQATDGNGNVTVNPGDAVNYVNGNGTTSNVNVTKVETGEFQDANGNNVFRTSEGNYVYANGTNVADNSTVKPVYRDIVNVSYDVNNTTLAVSDGTNTDANGNTVNNGAVIKPTGKAADSFVKAGDLADTLNNMGWNVHSEAVSGTNGVVTEGSTKTATKVSAGNTVTVNAGQNIEITRSGKDIAIATSMNPTFTSVKVGNVTLGSGNNTSGKDTDENGTVRNVLSVGSKGNETIIKNVAPGREPTDAVNVSQLRGTEQRLNNSIRNVDKRARRGIAVAGAIGHLPQPHREGKSMVSVGATSYRGEQALAVGYSRISDNGKHIIKLSGASNTSGHKDVMVGASYGYEW